MIHLLTTHYILLTTLHTRRIDDERITTHYPLPTTHHPLFLDHGHWTLNIERWPLKFRLSP